MSSRCSHRILVVDSFIDPEGAFCSCLFCSRPLELSAAALDHYLPFEHTSPLGERHDVVVLIHSNLLPP